MTNRKNSLQAVLERQAQGRETAPPPAVAADAGPIQAPPASVPPSNKPKKFHRPSRDGRKLIAGHFDPKVAKQIKLLAAEEETTVQALLEEALDLLFVKKGKGAIARD